MKITILLGLLLSFAAQAFDLPPVRPGEGMLLVMSQEQLESTCSQRNFATHCEPEGVCYGIDRLNFTLLTQVRFEPGQVRDSNYEILRKVVNAYRTGEVTTIRGFNNSREFADFFYRQTWDSQENPLKLAIIQIQGIQPLNRLFGGQVLQVLREQKHGKQSLRRDAQALEAALKRGVPLDVSLIGAPGAHAITVVGFQRVLTPGQNATRFLVIDSNSPGKLKTLELRQRRNEKGEAEDYWYYEPWDTKGKPNRMGQIADGNVSMTWTMPESGEVERALSSFRPQVFFSNADAQRGTSEMQIDDPCIRVSVSQVIDELRQILYPERPSGSCSP